MPSFEITGRGGSSGRKRKRTVRTLDRATALAMMEAEGTIVDTCVELPYVPSTKALREYVAALGLTVSEPTCLPECVFEVLNWCIGNHRIANIGYLTDIDGKPWRVAVEPHGFRKSKEGLRLRCYVPPQDDEPDVVSDFQTSGWHLYLIEDIDSIEASDLAFERRHYNRGADEVLVFSFRV